MADIDYQDYETAKTYYGKAKSCIDEGSSSDACKNLAKEGGEKALIAAGVDPDLAREAMQCAESRDSEVCAKASAKLAAVYACTSATGGSGYTLCNEIAPKVVDQIWPIVGPPLVGAWDTAFDVMDGVAGAMQGIMDALGDILGFGSDDGPTTVELHNQLMWRGNEVINGAIDSAVKATSSADIQSRIEVGLPVKLPNGSVGGMSFKPKPDLELSANTSMSIAKNVLSQRLREQQGFGPIAVEARTRQFGMGITDTMPLDYEFVDPGKKPDPGNVMLVVAGCPDGWKVGDSGWNPSGFELREAPMAGWRFRDVRDAYGMVLAARTAAIRDAASESVGQVVSTNVRSAKMSPGSKSEGGIGWFWWTAILGSGILAYVYRDKIRRKLRG